MTPKKPFMVSREEIELVDCYAVFDKNLRFRFWRDWDGTKFATREEAQTAIDNNKPTCIGARVIEVLDEIRARF